MKTLRDLISEIHRRSLWQVLAVYVVGAWVGYQVILDLVEGLGLPEWLPGLAVVLFVIGLPIVLATAMVQEGPPSLGRPDPTLFPGSELDDAPHPSPPPASQPAAARIFTWRNAISGGVAAFALWGVIAAFLAFRTVGGGGEEKPIERLDASAGSVTVTTDPGGASLRLIPIADGAPQPARTMEAGPTPVSGRRTPPGEYLLRIERPGHAPIELLLRVSAQQETRLDARLTPAGAPDGMLLVPAGPSPLGGGEAPDFLIDRFEVTNARYAEFVAAGGYENPTFWPDTLLIGGESLPWHEAMSAFVDRTGHPAPRGWSGGLPPAGQSEHPVVGVSWYEAAAYARWADKELPSWGQWWRAALGDGQRHFPWGDDGAEDIGVRANFSLVGTAPVGSLVLGLGPFGAADMAGNVREWLADSGDDTPDRRRVVGGGWADPVYMFEASHAEAFPPDFAGDHIGFRCVRDLPPR